MGSQAGKVTYETYQKNFHSELLMGGHDSDEAPDFDESEEGAGDGENVADVVRAMFAGANPYEGVSAYNPEDQLVSVEDRALATVALVDRFDEFNFWKAAMAEVSESTLAKYDTVINNHIADWETGFDSVSDKVDMVLLPAGSQVGTERDLWGGFTNQVLDRITELMPVGDNIDPQAKLWQASMKTALVEITRLMPVSSEPTAVDTLWETFANQIIAKISELAPIAGDDTTS